MYASYFETGIKRDGAQYIARYDGEFVGRYDSAKAAKRALREYIAAHFI